MNGNATQELRLRVTTDGVQQSTAQLGGMNNVMGGIVKTLGLMALAYKTVQVAQRVILDGIKYAKENELIVKKMNVAIRDSGIAAEYTSKQLQAMASSLQIVSNFDDENIMSGVFTELMRFKAITADVFPKASQLVLDMAEAMGGGEGSLSTAARTVGVALQDPILGMTRLRRSGVMFTEEQQAVVKQLVETGKKAEAQGVILDALSRKFGGTALAGIDAAKQLKNAWADYQEALGVSMQRILVGFQDGLNIYLQLATAGINASSQQITEHTLKMQEDISIYTAAAVRGAAAGLTIIGGVIVTVLSAVSDVANIATKSVRNVFAAVKGTATGFLNVLEGLIPSISTADSFKEAWENLTSLFGEGYEGETFFDADEMFGTTGLEQAGKNWVATFTNLIKGIDDAIGMAKQMTDRKREALKQDPVTFEPIQVDLTAFGSGLNTALDMTKDFIARMMALNDSEEQAVIRKYAAMKQEALDYLCDPAVVELGTERHRELTGAILEIEKARDRELAAINRKRLEDIQNRQMSQLQTEVSLLKSIEDMQDLYYSKSVILINNQKLLYIESGIERVIAEAWATDQIKKLHEEVYGTIGELMEEQTELQIEMAAIMETILNSLEHSMSRALTNMITGNQNFAESMKELWRSMVNSIISELTRLIVRMMIIKALKFAIFGDAGEVAGTVVGTVTSIAGSGGGTQSMSGLLSVSGGANLNTYISGTNSLSSRLDRLIDAIQTNPPQIYTQVIDGVPFHRAVKRAEYIANEL